MREKLKVHDGDTPGKVFEIKLEYPKPKVKTMSELKCPYCNKPLHCGATLKSDEYLIDLYQCANPECESTEFLVGCKEFWDILGQLIRTRKALDCAINTLETVYGMSEDASNIESYVKCKRIEINGIIKGYNNE